MSLDEVKRWRATVQGEIWEDERTEQEPDRGRPLAASRRHLQPPPAGRGSRGGSQMPKVGLRPRHTKVVGHAPRSLCKLVPRHCAADDPHAYITVSSRHDHYLVYYYYYDDDEDDDDDNHHLHHRHHPSEAYCHVSSLLFYERTAPVDSFRLPVNVTHTLPSSPPLASMASKRPSTDLIPNPCIKRRNLNWSLHLSKSNPPQTTSDSDANPCSSREQQQQHGQPTTSAMEAGQVQIANHLPYFASLLARKALDSPVVPLLPIASYVSLYQSHAQNPRGSHFVIHQHDHPVAGTHYDFRLQINPTSSVSWAIMYGVPGDPNSSRLNRNATETRIHSLWNHLIETASPHTGSLLIWDTGTYSVLPRHSKHLPGADQTSQGSSSSSSSQDHECQQVLLARAFASRKIRIRLHGSRLPRTYVLNLRLTRSDDVEGRAKNARSPLRKRRTRKGRTRNQESSPIKDDDTDVQQDRDDDEDDANDLIPKERDDSGAISRTERELRELEDAEVSRTNAYPGATNSIGSIHQRKWYLSLDRASSGFVPRRAKTGKVIWTTVADADAGADTKKAGIHQDEDRERMQRLSFPFYVRGVECERSVVTGRRGDDVLRDEGVREFIHRKGWRPVLN
ncbi:hypothetical protein E4U42_005316 [Claviceps africana]|uniref:DNA ligase D 3'-phosphoesterase domain-containing protein n=1 Tax=Claviceps africana TaxID=83212 RepID=A0A8K0JE02_9HYPO|nr:hypothetical protein E4U42_005316 [Claviceps africana]